MHFTTQILHGMWLTHRQVRWITHILQFARSGFYMTVGFIYLFILHLSLSLDPGWISSHVRQSCFRDYKYLCDVCLKLSSST